MAAGEVGCRVKASGDRRRADGYGKHEFFTLRYSDANTDTGDCGAGGLRLCDARNSDMCHARLHFVTALLLIPTYV